ncbi:C40 family peptidase [Planococcus sp. CAU13]|uniref:C40 family peptidase n=1 Tax=Planococcus sp. CAU13 TaxID=1541197 RepID=UPI00052FDD9A|nr:LysM peptidoglycan-binding domain-containing protein [Planococcus sp. CAU13]
MKKTRKALLALTATIGMSAAIAAPASAASYNVKSGDTLWNIAQAHGTTVASLQNINGISGHIIYPGQTLMTSGGSTAAAKKAPEVTTVSNSTSSIVSIAKQYTGVPYVWGGSTPSGFDCSGFISYVLNKSGNDTARINAAGYYNKSTKVSTPQPGDLVFFSGTYTSGISHVGFYIGDGKMISATNSGIKVDNIHSGYWSSYFTGYGRM